MNKSELKLGLIVRKTRSLLLSCFELSIHLLFKNKKA